MATIELTTEQMNKLMNALARAGEGGGLDSPGKNLTDEERAQRNSDLSILKDMHDSIEKSVEKRFKIESQELEKSREKQRLLQKELDTIEAHIRAGNDMSDQQRANAETAMEKLATEKKLTEEIYKQEKAVDSLGVSLERAMKGLASGKAPDIGSFVKGLDTKKIAQFGNALKGMKGAGALKFLGSKALAAAPAALLEMTKSIFDLALRLESTEAKFMQTTGASQKFASSVTESYKEVRKYGVGIDELSTSFSTLYSTFTDFTMATALQREQLAETGAVLQKLGISNEDFAKSIQFSTKALNISAEQAGQNMLDLSKFASELGVTVQKMGSDFANSGEMVAKLGSTGVKAFKDLAIVAKTTGMSMERLLAITDKFDTFEGAAESAGRLNAALGGNFVNPMDLMMATDPTERFRMLKDSLDQAGLSFDTMAYYQKKLIAESMGLGDVSELALVMSGNMDMLDDGLQNTQQSYIDAAKRAQELQDVQTSLSTAFSNMIPIIKPLVSLLAAFGNFVAEHADAFEVLGYVILGVSAIATAMAVYAFSPLLAIITAVTAAIYALYYVFFKKKSSPTFFDGILELSDRFNGFGNSVMASMAPLEGMKGQIAGVSKELSAIPTSKNVEFVSSMTAAAEAATMSNATNGVAAMAKAVSTSAPQATAGGSSRAQETQVTAGGSSRAQETIRQPVSIALNGDKMSDFVVEVIGEKIKEINIV